MIEDLASASKNYDASEAQRHKTTTTTTSSPTTCTLCKVCIDCIPVTVKGSISFYSLPSESPSLIGITYGINESSAAPHYYLQIRFRYRDNVWRAHALCLWKAGVSVQRLQKVRPELSRYKYHHSCPDLPSFFSPTP